MNRPPDHDLVYTFEHVHAPTEGCVCVCVCIIIRRCQNEGSVWRRGVCGRQGGGGGGMERVRGWG